MTSEIGDTTPYLYRNFWVHDGQKLRWPRWIDEKTNGPVYQVMQAMAATNAVPREHRKVAVDGGAHIGMYSFHLERFFEKVLAFEPSPENYECLKRNFAGKSKVETHNLALSNDAGALSMAPRKMGWEVVPFEQHKLQIPCIALDDMNMARLDLLKLDVEGHEYEALQGARKTIAFYKPVVIIEYKDALVKGPSPRKFLTSLGMVNTNRFKHDYLFIWG